MRHVKTIDLYRSELEVNKSQDWTQNNKIGDEYESL